MKISKHETAEQRDVRASLQKSIGLKLLYCLHDKQKSSNACAKYNYLNLSEQQEDEWFICHPYS